MSLDVYLYEKDYKEPVVMKDTEDEFTSDNCIFSSNITHNLSKMADQADLYEFLWRPEENGIFKAKNLIVPLSKGLFRLIGDPVKFKTFNPENGWGTYETLINFVSEYLHACIDNPNATVEAHR